ncbi:FHA domain-containing protein [Demequina sp. NBRC 110057]|uniref:FHA domain-containing protein n=1 Tax=Demequina sp. NBRC 110057 TaxID=1570346 RepID=UPI0009FFC61B|nr:FHA domain-containing protein [Demequina sp. NBRC 110057]
MNAIDGVGAVLFAPLAVGVIIDLVWMGLALGAVLRKVGLPSGQAFVPVLRWIAAAQAARMSRVAVGLARGIALAGALAALAGLVVIVDQGDAAPAWARLALVAGVAVNALGTLVGWVLWIYGSGTVELRLRAPAALSWVAAISPHIWASILGWGPYGLSGRTDDAARAARADADAPVRSTAVASSSFALGAEAQAGDSHGWATPATRQADASAVPAPTPPSAPTAAPEPVESVPAAAVADEPAVAPAPAAVTPAPATGTIPQAPAAPAESESESEAAPAAMPEASAAVAESEPEAPERPVVSLPPGWSATSDDGDAAGSHDAAPVVPVRPTWAAVTPSEPSARASDDLAPVRVSPFAAPSPAAPPADLRPLSAPSADDVPTLSAPSLGAATAAIPVVPEPEPEPEPEAEPAPAPEPAPASEPEPERPEPKAPLDEAPLDTIALSPYLTRREQHVAADAPATDDAQEPPGDATVIPGEPAVSPYLASAADAEAEPDWLVEARERAQQQSAGSAASPAEPTVAPLPPAAASAPEPEPAAAPGQASAPAPEPEPEPEAPSPAPAVAAPTPAAAPASAVATASADATESDDADDRTVIAARRRVAWRLAVGSDLYDLPETAVVIGRATAVGAPDRVGITDATRTMSKVHARLEPRGDRWFVADMGSTNGTFVRSADGAEIEATATAPVEVTGTLLLGDLEVRIVRGDDA